jgi:hypothetical protein
MILFLSFNPVNWDDRHLLANTMTSDFTVVWQYSQREFFLLRIKLHALCNRPLSSQPLLHFVQDGEDNVLAAKNGFVLRFGGLYTSSRQVHRV